MINFSDLTKRMNRINFSFTTDFGNFIEKYDVHNVTTEYKETKTTTKNRNGELVTTITKTPIGKKIIKNFKLSNGWIDFQVIISEKSKSCICKLSTRDSLDTWNFTYIDYLDFAKQFNDIIEKNSGCLYEIDKLLER